MKKESSQTMLPVAIREIFSFHLESFVTSSVDNILKKTHMPQRLLGLSWAWERPHCPALACWKECLAWSSLWLSWIPLSNPTSPWFSPLSFSLSPESRSQETWLKYGLRSWRQLPWGLDWVANFWNSEPCGRMEVPWLHKVLHGTQAIQTPELLQFPLVQRFSAGHGSALPPWTVTNVWRHDDMMGCHKW